MGYDQAVEALYRINRLVSGHIRPVARTRRVREPTTPLDSYTALTAGRECAAEGDR